MTLEITDKSVTTTLPLYVIFLQKKFHSDLFKLYLFELVNRDPRIIRFYGSSLIAWHKHSTSKLIDRVSMSLT